LPLETKNHLLDQIEQILQDTTVHQGIIIKDIKQKLKLLVSEQLEIRFNGVSESSQL
jgi:hypothetical protein